MPTLLANSTGFGGPNAAFVSNAVDVLDMTKIAAYQDTPLYSRAENGTAYARTHEWLYDTLPAAAQNAASEGAAFSAGTISARTRTSNYCQIFRDDLAISRSQEKVRKYGGIKSEMQWQMRRYMMKHARDIEFAIFNNATTGQATEPVLMKPAIDFCGNSTTLAATIAEQDINNSMQLIFNAGGSADLVILSPENKRDISAATVPSGINRNITAESKKVVRGVSFYEGDFGNVVEFVPSRVMPSSGVSPNKTFTAFVLQSDTWRVDFLDTPQWIDIAKRGDSVDKMLVSEGTVVCTAPTWNAKLLTCGSAFD